MAFTEKTLGILTTQLPHDNRRYLIASEVRIPLLEGGLLFRGPISPADDSRAAEVSMFVGKDLIDSAYVERRSDASYLVALGRPMPTERYKVVLHENPDHPQQFWGIVTKEATGETVKFTYTDIHEPITIGGVIIIVVGVAAILCSLSLIIGLIANWNCKKVEVTFGLRFAKDGFGIGCIVRCVEGAIAPSTPATGSGSGGMPVSTGAAPAAMRPTAVHNAGDGEMYGGRNAVEAPILGENRRGSFVWHNNTSKAIHDLIVDTNQTYGDDPNIESVTVYKLNDEGEREGNPIADVGAIGDTDVHIRFAEGIPPCSSFEVVIGFDDEFESDESISFTPTGAEGMPIN